jgi:acyl-CoA thioesterase
MKKVNEQEIHKQYYDQICAKLKEDPYGQHLGIELIEVGPGSAVAELEVQEYMLNTHGTAHGAIIFALADFVFAVASNSYGKTSVALSMNIGFLAPGLIGSHLRASAVEENRTHRTSWYRIRVESGDRVLANLDALAYRKSDYFIPVSLEE